MLGNYALVAVCCIAQRTSDLLLLNYSSCSDSEHIRLDSNSNVTVRTSQRKNAADETIANSSR